MGSGTAFINRVYFVFLAFLFLTGAEGRTSLEITNGMSLKRKTDLIKKYLYVCLRFFFRRYYDSVHEQHLSIQELCVGNF